MIICRNFQPQHRKQEHRNHALITCIKRQQGKHITGSRQTAVRFTAGNVHDPADTTTAVPPGPCGVPRAGEYFTVGLGMRSTWECTQQATNEPL